MASTCGCGGARGGRSWASVLVVGLLAMAPAQALAGPFVLVGASSGPGGAVEASSSGMPAGASQVAGRGVVGRVGVLAA